MRNVRSAVFVEAEAGGCRCIVDERGIALERKVGIVVDCGRESDM
jgi:hypothetical protein